MKERQKTIKNPVSVSGIGLHTGNEVKMTFKPAAEDHGIRFIRTDLENQPVVEADIDYVVDTSRGTTIEKNGTRIYTVEHTLAAISGMDIDNILIEIDCSEPPILDGSSRFFVEALKTAVVAEQNAEREYLKIIEPVQYTDKDKKVEMYAIPDDKFSITVTVDYETDVLGCQQTSLENISDFDKEISCSRTFVFLHELEYLYNNGLIKGGDLNNAIVFVDRVITDAEHAKLASMFNRSKVNVLKEGILDNIQLHYNNEPARHKLLDVIGDLTLIGKKIKGKIITNRPGHYSNIQFAKKIKQSVNFVRNKTDYRVYDPNIAPLYDINQIMKILPHRPPFLLIDKILEMSNSHVVGLKNVTMNEPFFVGHFPQEPVMPGVLSIEAMAQTGGILALSTVPDPENYLTLFMKIDNVKFKNKVCPGDTVIFRLELITPIRRGICHMRGIAYVNKKIVMEAEMMAQIVKKVK
jgi:UDP-3-O-[3-hydroxymyristoyl] N-acetylglucosamine deacetylase/3-hydroxyacyl-[acyl-carrier-protein] dehydratase